MGHKRKRLRISIAVWMAVLVGSFGICFFSYGEGTNENVLDARNSVVRICGIGMDAGGQVTAISTGSGFAVGREGEDVQYFVTNDHCVSGKPGERPPDALFVIFESLDEEDSVYPASIVYSTGQRGKDLAVLQIDEPVSFRRPAVIGSVSEVRETDVVYALGFPGDTDRFTGDEALNSDIDDCTVKTGHVTRVKGGDYRGSDFLVFEARINPGNSGGPLLNEAGEVIGVNTIALKDGNDDGAIYIDEVAEILDANHIDYIASKGPLTGGKNTKRRNFLWILTGAGVAAVVLGALFFGASKIRRKKSKAAPELFGDEDMYGNDTEAAGYCPEDDIKYL